MNYLRFLITCYHVTGYTYFTWKHWRQYVLMRTVFEKHQSFNTLNHTRPWKELFIWLLRLQRLETKDNIILLGVVLDSKLNFSEHIISICKKASQRIGVLMRLRNLIPMKSKLILFKSAILPFLTYCHLVWHFCKASDTRKLERLQERGLRAVFKENNSSYEQLLEKADLPTLHTGYLSIYLSIYLSTF